MNLRFLLLLLIIISLSSISGCSSCRTQFQCHDFTSDAWLKRMNKDPCDWVKKADRWFLTGTQNQLELDNLRAPRRMGVKTTTVKAKCFDTLVINGNFQVQVLGNEACENVSVMGPREELKQLDIHKEHNALSIEQLDPTMTESNIIVRIGMCKLKKIIHNGTGLVLGRHICTDSLSIISNEGGSITLAGNMKLRHLVVRGYGHITLLGVNTCDANVSMMGDGVIRLGGKVGLSHVTNCGHGLVEIMGGWSKKMLNVTNADSGIITLSGDFCNTRILASGCTRTFISSIRQGNVLVNARDRACIGLAGGSCTFVANLYGNAQLKAAKLNARSAYVKTYDCSHANVYAKEQSFVSSSGHSSVYFYGQPSILASNTYGNALVFPLCGYIPKYPWMGCMDVC